MARPTKLSIVRTQLKKKHDLIEDQEKHDLTEHEVLFIYSLFQVSKREDDPITHHIFCDEVAKIMSELGDNAQYDEHDVQSYVATFKENPFRFVATNGRKDCAGFRVTDYLIDWFKEIRIMK